MACGPGDGEKGQGMGARSGRTARRSRPAGDGGTPVAGTRVAGLRAPVVDGPWIVMGKDLRLTMFARSDRGLLRWTQRAAAGHEWAGPDVFEAPRLSHLTVVQGADGFVRFIGRRVSAEGHATGVVHAAQYQTGRPVTEWKPVGNPHKDAASARRIGVPAAAVSGSGSVHVFVANAGGGVSMRNEDAKGAWGPWRDLQGSDAYDGAVAVAAASGRVEYLAPGDGVAMRWQQEKPDGGLGRCPDLQIAVDPGSASGLETAPDRFTYYWSDVATGGLFAHRPGAWVVPLGGGPAEGRIAALRAWLDGYDCTVLAHRTPEGEIMLAACGTENEGGGIWWSRTAERSARPPALACDAEGRVVMALFGEDGALRIARQLPEPGLAMAPSARV
ncbi:putative protein OS=Streptomyces microflavus OX=1919 GN=Smic_65870 PE=4 SV=1 [Streptomyces microflavus]|uniref:Uncharacterized protein n=2 Tax=Streptomyces TaxID=1883 RepID=A0A7J0CZW3_STRMI|nr:hypothetical protein Smic_65870 [Streptomyces microflavus]